MKYQNNAFVRNFLKKLIWWYIILMLICIVYYFYFKMNMGVIPFDKNYIKSILSIFYEIEELKVLSIPILMFQIFLTIYTFISYFRYEEDNSPEFIYTRIDKLKCYRKKMIVTLIVTIIFRTIFFFINYFLYYNHFSITFLDYILCVGFYMFIIFILYVFCIIKTKLKY